MLNERNIAPLLKKTHPEVNESKMIFSVQELSIQESWFPLIWGYINKYGNLKDFQGLPLIPIGTESSIREVAVLNKESFFIYYEENEGNDIIPLLRYLGCSIIKELPSYVLQNSSVFKHKYMYEAKDESLLQVISNLEAKHGQNEIKRKFSEFNGKEAKLEFFHKVSHFSVKSNIQATLKSLPFIENTYNNRLVSVNECNFIAPKELPDVMPPKMLLKIHNKSQRQFLKQLGARQLSKREFIESILLPEIQSDAVPGKPNKSFMKYTLDNIALSNDRRQWQTVIEILSSIPFVESDDGELHKPTELFRRCEKLEKLFRGEKGRFPAIGQKIEVLKLKNESDVSADDIGLCLETVCDIEKIEQAEEKAKCILEHLECHKDLLENDKLISELKNTAWIPINRRRPDVYPNCLTWYGENNNKRNFERPTEMVLNKNCYLVGSVRAVIPSHIEDFTAIKLLKNSNKIPHQDVIDQLCHIINSYNWEYKNELLVALHKIYRFLQAKYNELTTDQVKCLKCMKWVWCDNCFVQPQNVVLKEYKLDMRPYMYYLPQDQQEMHSLLSICGSVPIIDKEKLIDILSSIKQEHERQTKSREEVDRDRKLSIEILVDLGKMELSYNDLNRILVPIRCEDTKFLLKISTQAVYSPIGGLEFEEECFDIIEEEDNEFFFLHECITEEISKSLHIRSLTNKLIDAEDLGIFEEYGQHEPLTRRINRILADYGDGLAIIKELIQNADDAGAKEVKFLYDERRNEDKRKYLIDPGMKEVQGPALWAYNDAIFSKEDFDNIVKLSGATKEDKRDKIGKFGLGFNAVYNITDVPSFISDNQLVILDPHTTHLGHAIKDKSKPGVKIPLGPRRNHLRPFKDQIRIYDGIFGMDANIADGYTMFEGTLFRFPLRTERQAQLSEIKNLCYSKDEMKELIGKFSLEANRLLMFTQNVRTVELFHLEEGTEKADKFDLLLRVSKKIFSPNINNSNLKAIDCQSFDIMNQSSLAVKCKAKGRKGKGITVNLRHVIDIAVFANNGLKELFEVEGTGENETWVIHSSIDDKECMKMALENVQLNPVASVAVCIDENKGSRTPKLRQQQQNKTGYFYCFLPLPIPNGLNVRINSTFALSKDRKSFQERSEDDKMYDTQETIWNRKLMCGPVLSAYIGLLKDLTTLIQVEDEVAWYSIWPLNDAVASTVCSYKQNLIKSFYHQIIKKNPCVFPNPREKDGWLNWQQVMTIEDSVKHLANGKVIEEAIEEVVSLFHTDTTIVHIPQVLLSTIEEAGFKKELSKIVLSFSRFFSKFFIPNVKKLRSDMRDQVLLFAIRNYSNNSLVCSSIKECNCIPTEPNYVLRKPSDLVKPGSKAADLFESDENVFPLRKFENCYPKLLEFGMLSDDIWWELLMHRAQTVNALGASKPNVAKKRVRKILQLVEEKISQKRDDAPDLPWKRIEFLPVKPKPSNWSLLEWEGTKSGKKFSSADKMYPSHLENIIGCHQLIIDNAITGKFSPAVEKLLGIRTQLTVRDVIIQVDIISKCIKGKKSLKLPAILSEVFHMIYCKLSEFLSKDPLLEAEIKEGFKSKPVIQTNDNTLVKSEQVAFHLEYDAKPYLYKLRNEFAMSYRPVMTTLGVRKSFSMEDYKRALIGMKNDAGGHSLSDSQLKTVRDLLESIDRDPASNPDKIFLPDKDKVLLEKELVVVKESPWMKNLPSERYLHEFIPLRLALSLGAKTDRSHSIASQSRGLPFGQHEKLTVRLKRILDAYPSQIQILYELLQNADDAGAREVKFVLDKRQHAHKKVFGDAWKSLQGPALLVYNDAPFTQRDIEGIQNLGEGSKSDDCQKTGQYGIGFNVVYHVTDAPCLLTKVKDVSVLCIFDPHACFLEECSDAEPGRMFKDGRNYLKNTFPDIYTTFLPEFLTNEESAILRLPLRSQSHASKSSIKEKATTTKEISEMFQIFKDKGPEAIVFLRNVKSVELFVIENRLQSELPSCLFSVHADMSYETKEALSAFSDDYRALSLNTRTRSEGRRNFNAFQCELRLGTTENKGEYRNDTWIVIQKCASMNSKDLPPAINDQYENGTLPLIPVGGIAYKTDGSLIDAKVYCLLPLAVSSSLPLHINGKFILDYESRRRLWYTNDDSFQKTWNYYVIEHCIIPCYVELFRKLALERNFAFSDVDPFGLLKEVFKDGGSHPKQIEAYFRNFPKLRGNDRAHEYEADLIKMFYKRIADETVNVMPVLRPALNTLKVEFCPPNAKERPFYYIDFSDHEKLMLNNSANICISLTKIGMNIYNIPADIVDSFSESEASLKKLTPEIVNEFLRKSSHIAMVCREELPLNLSVFRKIKTIKALLQYCSKNKNFTLHGLPLLVTEDEILRRFDDSKHVYYDEVSILFPSRKRMTLHPELRMTLSKYKDELSGALRKFTLDDFSRLLDEELNPIFKMNDEIVIDDTKMVNELLPIEHWLHYAWNFLRKRFEEWKDHRVKEENERVEKLRMPVFSRNALKCRNPKELGLVPMQFLNPISSWCLFPVERHMQGTTLSKNYYLVRITAASNAIDTGVWVKQIIDELGLPVPSSLYVENFDSSLNLNIKFLMEMATNTEDVNAFIDALNFECKRDNSGFFRLSTDTANELLRVLCKEIENIDQRRRNLLKDLPIWEDLSGRLRRISSSNNCYLICDDMPKDGTIILQDKYNVVLLRKHPDLTNIYKMAELETQNDSKVYCNLILENFGKIEAKDRFAHLSYLKDKYSIARKLEPDLSEKLKNTRIIEKNGELLFARDFYDPDVKLFVVMMAESDFPSKEYTDLGWLEFLRFLGLTSKVPPDLFCSYANIISHLEGKEERRQKSKALTEYLQQSNDLKEDANFLHRLSSIPFLVADKLNEKLRRIYRGKNEEGLLCFNGSILHSDKNIRLSWTSCNILPFYASKLMLHKDLTCKELGVEQNALCHSVACNLENVSKSELLENAAKGIKKYKSGDVLMEVYETAYEFLHNLRHIDDDALSVFCSIPLIAVNHSMVSIASKVTMERKFDIPPFLSSMPISLGKFAELFKRFGMTEEPTIHQLTTVLNDLFAASKGSPLDPNEANNGLKVIFRIMDIICEEDFPSDIVLLPLLGCYGKEDSTVCLYESQELIYFDDAHFDKRLTKLNKPRLHLEFMREHISSHKDKITQPAISRFITKLPSALQPKKISDIVKEVMKDSETIPNFGFTSELQSVMECIEFAECMIRLLKHQKTGESDDSEANITEISEQLSKIQIIAKESLQTVLTLRPNDNGEEGSELKKDVFITTPNEKLLIYVRSSLKRKSDAIAAIAAALVSFLESHFKDPKMAPLVNALLEKNPQEMHEYLDGHGIRRDFGKIDVRPGLFYSPGEFVPIELHCLLINDISKFDVGDYVAYEVEDPALDDKDGVPVYIYARILECETKDGLRAFYKIDIGLEEPAVVHKSELYGFYRPENLQEDSKEEQLSIEEVKENIRRELEEAFKQGEEHAKRIIKRLWLKWHPDKNVGNEVFCTEIFKFIQAEAARLRGESKDSFWDSKSSFKRYKQRGSMFNQQRRGFRRKSGRGYSWGSGYWRPPNDSKNPQPGEARRWFRQATFDLQAAKGDLAESWYEWVCFKCHQAVEKLLRAAVYMKDAMKYNHHLLRNISSATNSTLLENLADQIESLLQGSDALRYPDRWCYPSIPHDKYDINKAKEALKIAEKVFMEVKRIVNEE